MNYHVTQFNDIIADLNKKIDELNERQSHCKCTPSALGECSGRCQHIASIAEMFVYFVGEVLSSHKSQTKFRQCTQSIVVMHRYARNKGLYTSLQY